MVVDDHPEFAFAVRVFLESKGYHVTVAHDGVEALDILGAEIPDLVIMDVMMPRMDGWQALESIRENPTTAAIPALVLTACRSNQDAIQSFGAGCTRYYAKPISDLEDFALVVRQLLENPPGLVSYTTSPRAREAMAV
jgi:two-component system alkaline phosphatase synthesis response regulator PhoP/two-component system response regulator VicR